MQSEIEIKTERIQKMLAAEDLGGVLINAQHNFAWATGGRSNRINASIENGACFLLFRADGKRFVLANNIEMPRILSEEISEADFEPVEFAWQDEKASGDFVIERAKTLLGENKNVASDLFLDLPVRPLESAIARCRYELTDAEAERFRRLGKDAGLTLGKIFDDIGPGETEIGIANKVKSALAVHEIESVVTLVGADERIERFRHPVPTSNPWKKTLLIAVCAKRHGLIASLTRIACVGKIPDELQRKTEACAYVYGSFLSAMAVGASAAEIYRTAAKAYEEKGFGKEIDRHHQGGAAGYKSRDWIAHPASAETVRNRQAFAWNPSITGTKVEETVLIDGDRIEFLTASPGFPEAAVRVGKINVNAPAILKL